MELHLNLKTVLLTMMMFKWGIFCSASSDKCLSAPCSNGATCVDGMDDYACLCPREPVRYMGKDCELLYDACSFRPCEACTSVPGTDAYRCTCPAGMTGDNCTQEVDECESAPCAAPRSACVDRLDGFFCRCPDGFGGEHCHARVTDCVDAPCRNGGRCAPLPEGYECACADGFAGTHCEEELDECLSGPCQNGAICMDGRAAYHCFCVPGFQGYNCEVDINECASRPCENNATCINEKDRYSCDCLTGFTGVNCEVEIDECQSGPCQHGATCVDLVGLYSCECAPGYEGPDCEVDVDECASGPCLNGAVCRDLVDSYECDCSDTGFLGDHCEEDIPECFSDPCQHGATCLEGVKEYTCLCWPGYDGDSCEVDVDECAEGPCENGGECLERSDPSHWEADWEFSYSDHAGYLCQCQAGFAGENCSVDVNECESEPCQNGGSCEDHVNGYTCTCPPGFTGDLCEVNIDECASQPCENGGWCEDGVASFACHCPEAEPEEQPWGGERCQVRLLGCLEHRCQNSATCLPRLEGEEHAHTCVCPHGFYDDHCSTPTTFSFSTPGFIHIQVLLEEEEEEEEERRRRRREVDHPDQHHSLEVGLRFRTTLPNMLLFYRGDADHHLTLEILDGALRATASSEDAELEAAALGSVADGDWRHARVTVGDEGLALVLRGPGCDGDGCKVEDGGANGPRFQPSEAFAQVYVGGAPQDLLLQTGSGTAFLGCMEDLQVDARPVLPQQLSGDQALDMELGCSKTEWCEARPCSSHGRCVDLWTSYHCDCYRPHHGESCSEEYPSWTYSHEDSSSFSSFDVENAHGSNFTLSFFLTSLKTEGLLLQLRRPASQPEEEGAVYFSVYLGMGRLLVSSEPRGAPLTAPVFLASGEPQLVGVELQAGRVFFTHSGLRYAVGRLARPEVRAGDRLYVGGLPGGWDARSWGGRFKGCLQDLRLDEVRLSLEGRGDSTKDAYVAGEAENVLPGCVSDDTCQDEPCLHGGDCHVTWNDFMCSCSDEYTGKTCATRVWCVSDPCVTGGQCVDLEDGYECVSNATFDNSPVQFSAEGSLSGPVTSVYLEVRTRSENAVLLQASLGTDLLLVGLLDSSLRLEIHSGNSVETLAFSGVRRVADGNWHRVRAAMSDPAAEASPWLVTVDGIADGSSAPEAAGSLAFLSRPEAAVTLAESFTGCLGAVRVGGVYLPFLDGPPPPQAARFRRRGDRRPRAGCTGAPVCTPDPCLNGAECVDAFDRFVCRCTAGWEGPCCEADADDCAAAPCRHGVCRDFLAGFECKCHPGWAGEVCERDVDECEGHACQHGAACQDGINHYTCICPYQYSGPLCQWDYPPIRCEKDVQCANGVCEEGLWGANCSCSPGFTGDSCELEVDECQSNPCRNGGSCIDRLNRFLCVCPAGFSGLTCDTNKQAAQRDRVPWLVLAIPLVCLAVLLVVVGLTFMVLTARKKRQSEGAYSPSTQEVAGARLEMDSMLKVPPEERLI